MLAVLFPALAFAESIQVPFKEKDPKTNENFRNIFYQADDIQRHVDNLEARENGFVNRIINGDMRISQRYIAVSTTPAATAANTYVIDRFYINNSSASRITAQQISTFTATGFPYAERLVVASSVTIGASSLFVFGQAIEGYNVADLMFGSSAAEPITLTFWVQCSTTGTFAVAFRNASSDRSYVETFTVNAADTPEFKTITLSGDQTGTWGIGNGAGLIVTWDLGSGSTYNASAAGAWEAGNFTRVSGTKNLITIISGQMTISGVQLERGRNTFGFAYRSMQDELELCQRYYEKSYNLTVAPGTVTGIGRTYGSRSNGQFTMFTFFKTRKRTSPTMTIYSDVSGTSGQAYNNAASADEAVVSTEASETGVNVAATTASAGHGLTYHYTADGEF